MADQFTDGKISGWPCNACIIGNKQQGYELQTAPYAVNDESAPEEIYSQIMRCDGIFSDQKSAQKYAERRGFVPDMAWGEME